MTMNYVCPRCGFRWYRYYRGEQSGGPCYRCETSRLEKELAAVKEELKRMVPRSRIAAMEAELEESNRELREVQKSARDEIERLTGKPKPIAQGEGE